MPKFFVDYQHIIITIVSLSLKILIFVSSHVKCPAPQNIFLWKNTKTVIKCKNEFESAKESIINSIIFIYRKVGVSTNFPCYNNCAQMSVYRCTAFLFAFCATPMRFICCLAISIVEISVASFEQYGFSFYAINKFHLKISSLFCDN